jgi:hypothetical protein
MATTCCICLLAEGVHDDITVSRSDVRCVNEHKEWCCRHCYDERCVREEFFTARPRCAICRGRLYLDAAELEVEEVEEGSSEYDSEEDEEDEDWDGPDPEWLARYNSPESIAERARARREQEQVDRAAMGRRVAERALRARLDQAQVELVAIERRLAELVMIGRRAAADDMWGNYNLDYDAEPPRAIIGRVIAVHPDGSIDVLF